MLLRFCRPAPEARRAWTEAWFIALRRAASSVFAGLERPTTYWPPSTWGGVSTQGGQVETACWV